MDGSRVVSSVRGTFGGAILLTRFPECARNTRTGTREGGWMMKGCIELDWIYEYMLYMCNTLCRRNNVMKTMMRPGGLSEDWVGLDR